MMQTELKKADGIHDSALPRIGTSWHRHYIQVFQSLKKQRAVVDLFYRFRILFTGATGVAVIAWCGPTLLEAIRTETVSENLFIETGLTLLAGGLLILLPQIKKLHAEEVGPLQDVSKTSF